MIVLADRHKLHVEAVRQELHDYFAGSREGFTIPCALQRIPFQVRVWRMLTTIPYNHMLSYKLLAQKVSCALGKAHATNPIAMLFLFRVIELLGQIFSVIIK